MKTVLLLDADIYAFKIASVSQRTVQFDPAEEPLIVLDDWDTEVVPRIEAAILGIQEQLETEHVIICLSCPTAENFRLDFLKTYKGNRDYSKRPEYLARIKEYMERRWPSYRRPRLEADDVMGILSTNPTILPGRKIIVSEDKDMKTIPGWLFNPAKDRVPRYIDEEMADWWHMHQTICGDVTDGYAGCPGAGDKAATELLDSLDIWESYIHTITRGPRKGTELLLWKLSELPEGVTTWGRVVALYEKHGYTEQDALVQARVSRICRSSDYNYTTKEVIPWTPVSRPQLREVKTA